MFENRVSYKMNYIFEEEVEVNIKVVFWLCVKKGIMICLYIYDKFLIFMLIYNIKDYF